MFEEIKTSDDPCVEAMINKTEEGIKVERNKGEKYWAVFKRVDLN
jgi:tRNA (guanine-N7-)-methyltransferase